MRDLLSPCGYKRMWMKSDISVYHPVFHRDRGWRNRGACLIAEESSLWQRVSNHLSIPVVPCLTQCWSLFSDVSDTDWFWVEGSWDGFQKQCFFVSERGKLRPACLTPLFVSITSVLGEVGELSPCSAINSAF